MAKLLKLHLENYRNIKAIDIDFGGKDGKIIGANRIGKTNIIEAICYLLTDKLLGGSADVASIKNHDNPRATVVVEGTFDTKDGNVILRKEFYEKWVRSRGSATEELNGHATDYYINGAEQSRAKDFFEQLAAKFGIPTDFNGLDAYQLVIDPFYLAQVICDSKDWKFARKSLIEIIGDVTPEEIYAKDKNAATAKADLEAHQYDDGEAKKAIRGEIEGYKNQMIANEGLLDEYGKAEDVPEAELASAHTEDETLSDQISKLKAGTSNPYGDEVLRLQSELFGLNEKYQKVVTAPVDHSKSENIRSAISEKQKALFKLEAEHNNATLSINSLKQTLRDKKAVQDGYIADLEKFKNEFNSIIVEDVCPTCHQKLPAEMVQEAFHTKQAEIKTKAADTHQKAVDNKKKIADLEAQLSGLLARDYDADETVIKVDINSLQNQLVKAEAEEKASIKTPDPAIQKRIGEINARLFEIKNLQNAGSASVNDQIQALRAKKDGLQAIFSKHIAFDNAQKRLAQIRTDNVELGKRQADAEQRLWSVGEYVKAKLSLLDEHMAAKLGEVRFQLVKENIKAGSYDEVCVPYIISPVDGKHTATLFDSGSKSEQIYTGCQIIKAIRNAKGWEPLPVIFDQGGELDSVSANQVILDSEAQIIAVKVEGSNTVPTFVPFEQ